MNKLSPYYNESILKIIFMKYSAGSTSYWRAECYLCHYWNSAGSFAWVLGQEQ